MTGAHRRYYERNGMTCIVQVRDDGMVHLSEATLDAILTGAGWDEEVVTE